LPLMASIPIPLIWRYGMEAIFAPIQDVPDVPALDEFGDVRAESAIDATRFEGDFATGLRAQRRRGGTAVTSRLGCDGVPTRWIGGRRRPWRCRSRRLLSG
jgi:hypothetical protein